MKLIIQIPCYNEEQTLPQVIADLPKEIPGIDVVEYLIIDDGSADRTIEVARELGVHHVVPLGSNRGLATAFLAGIRKCVDLGADIIVNTDGDNQYRGDCIPDLVQPILEGQADFVVGSRPIEAVEEFSWLKKKLQRLGSHVVRKFSNTEVRDTTSGFRAYSAEAAMKLHVFNRYTYTLETIIQGGHMHMRIVDVPIGVNAKTRESRLMRSTFSYIRRSMGTIFRAYVIYRPLNTFFYASLLPWLLGLFLGVRFLYYHLTEASAGKVQSVMFAGVCILIGFGLNALGVLAHLMSANRELIQECLFSLRIHSRDATRAAGERAQPKE
ncbi:glycosyltransferase family 2 protein [bacterium]|nr:glycosyltransferase family 2 protein [bacterium]